MKEKKLVIGILAHVDAGKTTLTEGLLYQLGKLRKMGRVDHGDAFLDTHALERERGITIFSKQALFELADMQVTLLDTPGHTDFSAETERTLSVLDYCILVVSGTEGVQAHTRTLWNLLATYHIPTFVFVNKMDRDGADQITVLEELQRELSPACIAFEQQDDAFFESLAVLKEELLEQYLEKGSIQQEQIRELVAEREAFPCYFGSALRCEGIDELIQGLQEIMIVPKYGKQLSAYVYKISRDDQGNRLTHMKITGGCLKVRDVLVHEGLAGTNEDGQEQQEEKVNQIRIYSGVKFEAVQEAGAGTICAVTGLTKSYPGEVFGDGILRRMPLLEPVMSCRVELPDGVDASGMLIKLKQLEEENPELHIVWDEKLQEIQLRIMGEIQTEVLKNLIQERYGVTVGFGPGNILYKETVINSVEGIGHFEPLRHYAEVHLKIEPGERGSGITIATDCSEDELEKNWQRLILTHLREKEHVGVLTGSPLTDVKLTLIAGRAHKKHTEGGDFRQATYRAVRQGLMQAESVLLEPYYRFRLTLPREYLGRAMTDIDAFAGNCDAPQIDEDTAVLTGTAPVSTIRGYAREVTAYTKGLGFLALTPAGYDTCHDGAAVKAKMGYDPDRDLRNPSSSVFCAHGAGFVVEWDQVPYYMHLEAEKQAEEQIESENENPQKNARKVSDEEFVGVEEVDAILAKAYYSNRKAKHEDRRYHKQSVQLPVNQSVRKKPQPKKEEYLLVDGYNIVFAWQELKELSKVSIDGARDKLLDILCNYQGMRQCNVIAVFDAYRVQGHPTERFAYHNINVVFTKEAETADQYIEAFAKKNASEYDITVATSDHLEQMIIYGAGCQLWNAEELYRRVTEAQEKLREEYLNKSY